MAIATPKIDGAMIDRYMGVAPSTFQVVYLEWLWNDWSRCWVFGDVFLKIMFFASRNKNNIPPGRVYLICHYNYNLHFAEIREFPSVSFTDLSSCMSIANQVSKSHHEFVLPRWVCYGLIEVPTVRCHHPLSSWEYGCQPKNRWVFTPNHPFL